MDYSYVQVAYTIAVGSSISGLDLIGIGNNYDVVRNALHHSGIAENWQYSPKHHS